jgi:hypothetical protein
MPIYRDYLIEPSEQEIDAIWLHALGRREVVDAMQELFYRVYGICVPPRHAALELHANSSVHG